MMKPTNNDLMFAAMDLLLKQIKHDPIAKKALNQLLDCWQKQLEELKKI